MITTHATPFAGSWYPGSRAELQALSTDLFDSSLARTGPYLLPRPLAFVVPHAGLAYSGVVAASAYRHLQAAKPGRVFILGFTHRGGKPGISIPDVGAFSTPLGQVGVDQRAARELASRDPFTRVAEDHVCDHSVEIQLPLLQKAVPGVLVVPLYVGHLNDAQRDAAAESLARQVRPGDVLLASSDLTHYGQAFHYQPFPNGPDVVRRLAALDSDVIDAAGSLDPALFLNTLRELGATVCGYEPIALLLATLGHLGSDDVFQQELDYQTSAELTGDFRHSVSYGSLGYFRADSFHLDAEARQALLQSARQTLDHVGATGERKLFPPANAAPSLMHRAMVFVTLRHDRALFGCVGSATARYLLEAAPAMTLAAALDDPRFPQRASLPDGLDIEISILTPMKRIRDWRMFQIGCHGAKLEYGSRCELLLPQVATRASSEARFLETLSRKADLPPDAYRDPQARLSVFQAQVFG